MKLDELKSNLLTECSDDYVGLWRFPWDVREELGIVEESEVKQVALGIIKDLLLSGVIVAGDLDGGKFSPWQARPTEAFDRIQSSWDSLGREPGMLEIAWLTAPGDDLL